MLIILFTQAIGYCENISAEKLNKIVNAIYKIENSKKYPYGIKSIPIKGNSQEERERYARRICENTVRNNWIRWQKQNKPGHFLDFLANRYCPVTSDPQGNVNWKKNIKKIVGITVDNSRVIK